MKIASNIKQSKIDAAIPEFLKPILENQNVVLAGGAGRRFFKIFDNDDFDLFFIQEEKTTEKTKDELEGYLMTLGFKKIFQ